MAKPSEAQIRALEKAHKQQLINLLQAIRMRYIIYQKLGKDSAEWKKYADMIWKMWQSWYKRQLKYESSGGAQKENILKDDWLTPEGNKKLKALSKKWDQNGEGVMGFIPLLIWAVIAIAGLFTADQIVDELNTTTDEQAELIKTTEDYCTKYNLSKEECQKFMTEQNLAVTSPDSGIGGIFTKLLLFGGLAFVGYEFIIKPQQKKS